MRVVKVLNNSLVLALDEEGQEAILMGKGIGFHKATGSTLKKEEVEKKKRKKEKERREDEGKKMGKRERSKEKRGVVGEEQR